jgi:TPR repeat protein
LVITPSKTKAGQGWPGLLDLTGADELCAIFFVIPKGDMKGEWKQCAVKPFLALILISGASLVQLPVSARAQTPVTTVDPKLLALAKAGDTRSQLLLGYAYNKGEEAPLDLDEASAWYHKAAEGGDATAQFALGWAYLSGGFGTEDHKQASTWFRKSAEHADSIDLSKVPTMFLGNSPYGTLGFLYDDGKELGQDYSQAAFWYRKGAQQGDVSAQLFLGALYMDGKGVPQDYSQAAVWTRKAAEQGNSEAQSDLGSLYLAGRGVPQDYKQAKEWLDKAANQGDATAAYNLGTMYAKGQGVPQNNGAAYMLFDIAAARLTGPSQIDAEKARDLVASMLTPEVVSSAQEAAEKWFARFPVRR